MFQKGMLIQNIPYVWGITVFHWFILEIIAYSKFKWLGFSTSDYDHCCKRNTWNKIDKIVKLGLITAKHYVILFFNMLFFTHFAMKQG